ncbi:SDR family NAD(P)-dependent oxidoreductase [Chondromyces apiculatus]|uniref:Malonyl CoA-acyl carrier protein transacylase n=1 Tax=Chondromyces apiculatus DSM 436 TaxID=1192034 RepID=A0A017T2M8_9BACT|nr:type I polyketide synthase [Chondromyces apiculatus]EYF03065.1 Malonyl CoA-acyl carrier protein transacylase [Chondromyces apiculatus DSM 436]
MDPLDQPVPEDRIAIIGMAGRFPGAKNVDQFWRNVRDGVESIVQLTSKDLAAAGVPPEIATDPSYVRARAVLDDVEWFDAAFFGMTPREAEMLDPQHRFFLECAWEALEHAGYNSEAFKGAIGVYAGASGFNTYFLNNLYPNQELRKAMEYPMYIANEKDFLATRTSYKLNLRGPSVTLQTGCSTSLVAVHMACQALLTYQCDIALAGGVAINVPARSGYLYRHGMILSPDGRCRAFDAEAQGTVVGNGAGVVLLRRLEDALDSGDHIEAVIRGSAVNNDGSAKIGFTAPGVEGQAQAIAQALAMAETDPETVTYVEAHGTGTRLGDPIEIAALTRAFRARSQTQRKNWCAITSAKPNIGHLDAAAGIAGLIKAIQALRHRQIPPSLHFRTPNPEIDFSNSPFHVNTELTAWESDDGPRRAGVSSFGIGGTNAHVVLEEAPHAAAAPGGRPWQLLLLSARTRTALDSVSENLVTYLKEHPEISLPDVTFTLQVGRKAFPHRRMLICKDGEEAATLLSTLGDRRVLTQMEEAIDRPVVFMFSGQGTQYVGMAQELYEREPTFRAGVDLCAAMLQPEIGLDLREVLYPPPSREAWAAELLKQTRLAQPALFVIEYALATLWMEWGVKPAAMIGHSLGEYVAACLAGVFPLQDALTIVAKRGQLMQEMPAGGMLSVPLPEAELQPYLGGELSLAAVNGPSSCVVAGPLEALQDLDDRLLAERDVESQRLQTSHAFHSSMMEPIIPQFTAAVRRARRGPPKIPIASNLSGAWLSASEAQSPEYWARHLREPVRFLAGLGEVLADPARALLEVGPGRVLATLARQHPSRGTGRVVLSSIRHPQHRQSDAGFLMETLGQLWLSGIRIDWSGFYTHEPRRRVSLPTYPFERSRFWIDPPPPVSAGPIRAPARPAPAPVGTLQLPTWKRSVLSGSVKPSARPRGGRCCLLYADSHGLGARVEIRLRRDGYEVITVRPGAGFAVDGASAFVVDPASASDHASVFGALRAMNRVPSMILFLWGVAPPVRAPLDASRLEAAQILGFHSLVALAQAVGASGLREEVRLGVVTSNMQKVTETAVLCPEKCTVLGPCRSIPREYPNVSTICIDVDLPEPRTLQEGRLIDQILAEVNLERTESVIAYRNGERWIRTIEPARMDRPEGLPPRIREGGVYVILGGLGLLGSTLAEHFARVARAKLVLTSRTVLPPRETWGTLLASTSPEGEPLRRRLRSILHMEKLGGEVLLLKADVTQPEEMRAAIAEARQRFGRIDGVIHAAGITRTDTIQATTRESADAVLGPKLQGALVLDDALRGFRPDFIILCASREANLGGARLATQSAASMFLDAFAQRPAAVDGPLTIAIDWDPWQFSEGPRVEEREEADSTRSGAFAASLTREDALDALMRILTNPVPQVIVARREEQAAPRQAPGSIAPPSKEVESDSIPRSVHPRPDLGTAYVAPRDPLERAIAETWEKLFGIDRIGVHDDFFALGGDSLLAVQVISRLRGVVNMDLPGHSLLNARTVAALAELIAQSDSPSSTSVSRRRPARTLPGSLVLIKPGTERPLFLMHPVGGHVYFYHDMAMCLDPAQPVYGLQAQGMDGKEPPLARIEEMAARYLEAVKQIQPEGPYLLGGASFGGIVAFEMAHQLISGGQRVALLTMMDTPSPAAVFPQHHLDSTERLAYLISGDAGLNAITEDVRHLSADEQLLNILRGKKGVSRMFPNLALPELASFRKIVTANLQAALSYVPRSYPGQILFFQARERDALSVANPSHGWIDLALGGLVLHDVPGNHITMNLPPNVPVLAEHLRRALASSQAQE